MNRITALRLTLALGVAIAAGIAPLAANAAPVSLAAGSFTSAAHPTMGVATIYKLDDGSRVLRRAC
jgi:hypothetical protein